MLETNWEHRDFQCGEIDLSMGVGSNGDAITNGEGEGKGRRQPNWTEMERMTLLEEYTKRRNILRAKWPADGVRPREKRAAWEHIAAAVNVENMWVHRSLKDVQKKWHNMVCTARHELQVWKEKSQNPTEGPAPPALSAITRRILNILDGENFEDDSLDYPTYSSDMKDEILSPQSQHMDDTEEGVYQNGIHEPETCLTVDEESTDDTPNSESDQRTLDDSPKDLSKKENGEATPKKEDVSRIVSIPRDTAIGPFHREHLPYHINSKELSVSAVTTTAESPKLPMDGLLNTSPTSKRQVNSRQTPPYYNMCRPPEVPLGNLGKEISLSIVPREASLQNLSKEMANYSKALYQSQKEMLQKDMMHHRISPLLQSYQKEMVANRVAAYQRDMYSPRNLQQQQQQQNCVPPVTQSVQQNHTNHGKIVKEEPKSNKVSQDELNSLKKDVLVLQKEKIILEKEKINIEKELLILQKVKLKRQIQDDEKQQIKRLKLSPELMENDNQIAHSE